MFDLPFVAPGDVEDWNTAEVTYEGLPLVSLVGDKGEGGARAAYERGYWYYEHDNDNTPLEIVTALLLLSTKYDLTNIRKDIIKHLSRHYPTTLTENEALDEDDETFGGTRGACHLELLEASVTAQADILLPTRYYACTAFTVNKIFEIQSLNTSTLITLQVGR